MVSALVNREKVLIKLQSDFENLDQLNQIRNAIYAESVSRDMDHEPALVKSVGPCLVEGTKISAQIDCVDQEAMNAVLDFMSNELEPVLKIEHLSLQQHSYQAPSESFTPQYANAQFRTLMEPPTLGQKTAEALTQDPNYSILSMSPEDFRDLLETMSKAYQNSHQKEQVGRTTVLGN